MLRQIPSKEHPRLNAVLLNIAYNLCAFDTFAAGQKEAKPARSCVLRRLRQDKKVLHVYKCRTETREVVPPPLHKGRQFLQLRHADCRLQIRRLQIIAKMRIDVFVIVAMRQLSVLSVETATAEIVLP